LGRRSIYPWIQSHRRKSIACTMTDYDCKNQATVQKEGQAWVNEVGLLPKPRSFQSMRRIPKPWCVIMLTGVKTISLKSFLWPITRKGHSFVWVPLLRMFAPGSNEVIAIYTDFCQVSPSFTTVATFKHFYQQRHCFTNCCSCATAGMLQTLMAFSLQWGLWSWRYPGGAVDRVLSSSCQLLQVHTDVGHIHRHEFIWSGNGRSKLALILQNDACTFSFDTGPGSTGLFESSRGKVFFFLASPHRSRRKDVEYFWRLNQSHFAYFIHPYIQASRSPSGSTSKHFLQVHRAHVRPLTKARPGHGVVVVSVLLAHSQKHSSLWALGQYCHVFTLLSIRTSTW